MKREFNKYIFGLAATTSLLALTAGTVHAQEDTIIVTATKRAQSIQDVPFSINAQTQEDIQRTGAGDLEELSRNVAGLTIQNLGPGQSQVAIRGVAAGQIVRDQPGVKEQVGIYLDESVISVSLFTPDLDLFDLNRVETLRGPQGTLFGSGSVGGTVRYITNQPDPSAQSGMIEANLNTITDGSEGGHLKGVVNVPLGENSAMRVVGYHTEYGGFIDAITRNGVAEDKNKGDRSGARISFLLSPSENVSLTPRFVYQKSTADGFNRQETFNLFANPNTLGTQTLQEREQFLMMFEEFDDEVKIFDLTAEVGFDGADLTSVTSYTDRDILVSRDASALTHSVSLDLGYPLYITNIPSNLRDTTAYKSWTQEVRLASNGNGPFDWLVGAFYADISRDYAQRLPTPGYDVATDQALGAGTAAAVANGFGADSPFNSDLSYDLTQFAVFGEANWAVSDQLTLTAGGRYYDFEEDRTITTGGLFAAGDSNVQDSTASDGFTPRFLASYEVNENVTLNAQASQGFRLGGVNDPLNTPLCSPADLAIFGGFQDYGDETLWNYEAGVKANTGQFQFNGAFFYNDISDLQVTLDAGSCSSRIVFNVPEAHSSGVEAEMSFAPTENLEVFVSGTILEAEFDSTVVDGNNNIINGLQEGKRLPTAPQFQMAASAVYDYDASWAGNADGYLAASVQHVGSRYTQPGDEDNPGTFSSGLAFGGFTGAEVNQVDLELDPYTTMNVSAGFEWDNDVELVAYVNNITDENANLSFDRERGGRARLGFRTNKPRTMGVTVRKSF